MPKRKPRVDELLKREISSLLHTDYRGEAVYLTITSVDVSPDFRHARVYYSVFGGEANRVSSEKLLRSRASEIRRKVGKAVILKYLPYLEFVHDPGMEKGFAMIEKINELESEETEEFEP